RRHPLRPAAHHVLARRPVIGRVHFDRAEGPAIEGEEGVTLRASGIEGPHPGGVVPALCPEMDASADTYGFARRIRATPFVLRFRATSLCYVSVLRLFVVTGTYANTSSFPLSCRLSFRRTSRRARRPTLRCCGCSSRRGIPW